MRAAGLVVGAVGLTMFVGPTFAQAAGNQNLLAQDTPFESLSTPVGLTAVGLGVVGMVTGVLRRKKAEVQPQNQRKG